MPQCNAHRKYSCKLSIPCPLSDTKFMNDVEWRMFSSPPLKVNATHTNYTSIGAMFVSHDWLDYHLRGLFINGVIPTMNDTLCGELQEAYQRWIPYDREKEGDDNT